MLAGVLIVVDLEEIRLSGDFNWLRTGWDARAYSGQRSEFLLSD